ncbi:MAG: hypothetical protein AB8B53_02005 [Flavobacteriales bacterium]
MKRKIITDQNPPEAKESPREFSELLKEYHSLTGTGGSGSSLWKYLSAAAVVAVIISAITFWNTNPDKPQISETTQTVIESNSAKTPLPYEYTTYSTSVSATKESLVVTPQGVIIEVPENAFKSSAGMSFSDMIELKLTHYDDPLSIIMSQIPMHYDSAGTKYHFQSDGMFNITALINGEEVELNEELTIHYPQTTGRANSKNYILENNEWKYMGSSPMKSADEVCNETIYRFNQHAENSSEINALETEFNVLSRETAQLKQQVQSLKANAPSEPRKQNYNNYRFYLDVNPAEFPELSSFEQVLFEVKDSRFNFSMFDQTWNDISVKKSPREGRYLVTLKSGRRVEIFDVYPVLEDQEFDEAFAEYSSVLKNSLEEQKSLETQIAENETREAVFLADLDLQKEKVKQESQRNKVFKDLLADLNPNSVYRTINLGNLSVVNFDMGISLPAKGMPVPAEFYVAEDNTPLHQVFFIDLKDNIYYSFTRSEFPEFRYLKGKNYLLTSVLPDGTLVNFRGDLNSDEIKRGKPHRFLLEKAPMDNVPELKVFLGLNEEPA